MNFGSNKSRTEMTKRVAESLFVVWIVVVNVLYYAQFRDLFVSRLGYLVRPWH